MSQPLTCNEIADGAIVGRYVAGKLSAEVTDRFEVHLLDCGRCQAEVRLAWAVRKDLGSSDASMAPERDPGVIPIRPRRRFARVAAGAGVAAAAAAILLFAIPSARVGDPSNLDDPHRAPALDTRAVPVPVAPVGTVERADEIRWTSVAIADRYRLILLDQEGEIAWEHETADTFAIAPDGVVFDKEVPYYWTVDARIGFDRWVASEMATFRVTPQGTGHR